MIKVLICSYPCKIVFRWGLLCIWYSARQLATGEANVELQLTLSKAGLGFSSATLEDILLVVVPLITLLSFSYQCVNIFLEGLLVLRQ